MDKPSPITKLLHSADFPAEGLLQRGQYLHRLDRLLGRLLDTETKLHCQVGNVRDGVLIIYIDSTAWATRLRYQTPALLQELQQRRGLEGLKQIELRVVPKQNKTLSAQQAKLSHEASSCLTACAESVEDEGLSNALRRLAAHHPKGD